MPSHEATRDTVLLGRFVPKGVDILFPAFIGQEEAPGWFPSRTGEYGERKVGYWQPSSAGQFIPERWLNEDGSFDVDKGPSMPFGLGIRACFGKNLAVSDLV